MGNKGLPGGNKEDYHDRAANHASTPLNQLRDPASFGPPPKRTGTSSSLTSPTTAQAQPQAAYEGSRLTASTGGLGAPLSKTQIEENSRLKREREEWEARQREEEEGGTKPTGPYRADTTGLSTAGLPPPPKFRGAAGSPPVPQRGIASPPTTQRAIAPTPATKAPPPSLPPRLPPRGAASPPAYESVTAFAPAAETERGVVNQNAVNRLGAAGVQVRGLGISSPSSQSQTTSPAAPQPASSSLSELQSRFSRFNVGSPNSTPSSTHQETGVATSNGGGGGAGTTWAQKQAALRTASNFHKDPSSVSLSDARTAASTANNFRERHGEQVTSGWKTAQGVNQKYGIAERFGGVSGGASSTAGQESGVIGGSSASAGEAAAAKKKAPPPPPAKKVGLGGGAPPPINFANKPGMS